MSSPLSSDATRTGDRTGGPKLLSKPMYLNRELSWMAFNERVLEEALDPANPLLERLRFLNIFHTNLDEFFMIRVSGLKQQVAAGVEVLSRDGLSPRSQLVRIKERLVPLLETASRCLHEDVLPQLEQHGVQIVRYGDLSKKERARWDRWYLTKVHPVLTPLAVGSTHPFPFISNLSLNLAMRVRAPSGEARLARVKVPLMLSRLVPMEGSADPLEPPVRLLLLEEIIAANLQTLFPGVEVEAPWAFRVTRDADLEIREDEADDLLKSMQEELRKRRFGEAIRLEVQEGMPDDLRDELRRGLEIEPGDVYEVRGLLGVPRLTQLLSVDQPNLKYRPFVPRTPRALTGEDIFQRIADRPVLVHHPFDSFAPVVDFIRAAASDPRVLAIKQTLYRTSGDSPIVQALEDAVENGKQVAAIIELKARFDEESNIAWARRLEQAGIHVVYGLPRLKVHSKLALVVRAEGDELRRYAHVGTGNYNPVTARVYTDFGLFTADPDVTADVADVFNQLTGFARPGGYRKLLVAPRHMKEPLLERIRAETEAAVAGREAAIILKCNAITDLDVIDALYEASRRGVRVDLLVRGICSLIPGVKGMSENIDVRSVVGRFLEHSRVFWFHNGGEPVAYIGSADLMVRNLERRVEVLTPVDDPENARWLREVFLERYLRDVGRTRQMQPDGSWVRIRERETGPDVHQQFLDDIAR